MFRFTIRDVLWLMVVVGVAAGWWQAENRLARQQLRLTHLRANFEDVLSIAKPVGLHVSGEPEERQVRIVYQKPDRQSISPTAPGIFVEIPNSSP